MISIGEVYSPIYGEEDICQVNNLCRCKSYLLQKKWFFTAIVNHVLMRMLGTHLEFYGVMVSISAFGAGDSGSTPDRTIGLNARKIQIEFINI